MDLLIINCLQNTALGLQSSFSFISSSCCGFLDHILALLSFRIKLILELASKRL